MAQPANTFDSYDQVGIKEDLQDVIYDVSPDETPFYSSMEKKDVKSTNHQWQTDALRASADNAHIEGDDTTAAARSASVLRSNNTQIFKDAVITTGTDEGLDKAGRTREMAYQVMKVAKEQKLDIERAMFLNNAKVAGNNTTARELAGAPTWLITNTSIGATGSDATGDGSDARTDGTQRAFTQTLFDDVMQQIWVSGGRPDTVYLSAYQMNIALGFTGNNNQRSTIKAEDEKVIKHMDVYVTSFGTVEFVPVRENRGRDVFIMQSDMWACGVLRGTKNEALAKTGDNEKRQVVTELTLICKNEKASGMVADLSTS